MKPGLRRFLLGGAAMVLFTGTAGLGTAAPTDGPTEHEQRVLQAGLQLTGKGTTAKQHSGAVTPNPYLAHTADATATDWAYWRKRLADAGAARAADTTRAERQAADEKASGRKLSSPLLHDELEPAATHGSNDTPDAAEPVKGFGTGKHQNPRLRILGTMPDLAPTPSEIAPGEEDNGSIPLATDTGITAAQQAVRTSGVLGDGPHGPDGTGSNDFDFYKVESHAGERITASTAGSPTDTIAVVYSADGELLAAHDDVSFPDDVTSNVTYDVTEAGDYYILIGGWAPDPIPADPNDSGSGAGDALTGDYALTISSAPADQDFYAVKLRKGDVLGGSVTGSAGRLTVHHPDGEQRHGSDQDASSLYPVTSPLPAGGNAVVSYVAEEAGWYTVSVASGTGSYDTTVEVYRPGSETDTKRQAIFLDFDGGRVNTAVWGGPGVRQLSPFSSFVAKWGLPRSAEGALIDGIVRIVKENLRKDLVDKGLNPNVAIRVLNSRDHADPFGQNNVSRVVVGGTIAESGINTIGIAQYIDPGNFGHEDNALVLLDVLSGPSGTASVNTYLSEDSDRETFVAQAVGNVVSHEVGHFIGNYHVDQFNEAANLMDQGGNASLMFGVGPDGVGGTADDVDVDFGEDAYNPNEGFTGIEDTLNVSAWAFVRPIR